MGAEPQPSGTTVAGRYRLEERVGRGGMADVHAAHDVLLDRRVAVKLLRDAPDSEGARRRFVSEVRILAGLSHPGLVTVLDAGMSDEQPFLVMELLPGTTAADLVGRGAQPVDRATDLGAQVAAALARVHQAGVIHRDVKPSNILLDADGRARLADFGIARLVGDTVRATATGMTVGTMAYLAPEQAAGAEVGTPADVYSLGLVLLELLTGSPAFSGTATEAALARLTRDPVVPTHLPSSLTRLLAQMTAREPAVRPGADQVAAQLAALAVTTAAARAAQAGVETQAVAPFVVAGAPAVRRGWTARRTRAGVLAAAAVAVAVGLGSTLDGAPADDGPAPAADGVTAAAPQTMAPLTVEPGAADEATTVAASTGTTDRTGGQQARPGAAKHRGAKRGGKRRGPAAHQAGHHKPKKPGKPGKGKKPKKPKKHHGPGKH